MTARRYRILIVLGTSTGGIGQHVRSLAAGLVSRGHLVVVAGPGETATTFSFTEVGARFVEAPIGVTPSPRDLKVARSLARWVKGADVVHAHGFRAGLVALGAGAGSGWPVAGVRRAGVPLVVTWHNQVLATGVRGQLMHRAESAVARGATVSLGASADLVERAVAAGGRAVLGPVAAPRPARPRRTRAQVREALGVGDAPVVLAVGRLHPQKDYPTLVTAMAAMQHREPRPVLLVVGDGPDEARVRQLVVAQGVAARLLGRRDDVADLLHAADVLALSSVWEARALVVQEAMQVGLPVVATSVGGIPELVGDDALLVPAGDASAFAAALERVLDEPSEAAERAHRGLIRAATWPDEAAVVDQVIDVYRDVHRRSQR
jgi:glycosyltransferase involved in cell wall biosynthesis